MFEAMLEVTGRAAFDLPATNGKLELKELRDLAGLAVAGIRISRDETRLELQKARVEIQRREVAATERNSASRRREVDLKETKYRDYLAAEQARREAAQAAGEKKEGLSPEALKEMEEAAHLL